MSNLHLPLRGGVWVNDTHSTHEMEPEADELFQRLADWVNPVTLFMISNKWKTSYISLAKMLDTVNIQGT